MGRTQILYSVVLFLRHILTFPHITAYNWPSTNAVLLWTWLMWDLNISLLSRVTLRCLASFSQGIGVPKSEIVPGRPRRTTPVNVLRLFWKVHGTAFALVHHDSPFPEPWLLWKWQCRLRREFFSGLQALRVSVYRSCTVSTVMARVQSPEGLLLQSVEVYPLSYSARGCILMEASSAQDRNKTPEGLRNWNQFILY